MTRARDIANLVDANGDIVAGALDNVPAADVVNDTTPQLGGNLDLNSSNITGTGNIDVTGTVTADGATIDGARVLVQRANDDSTIVFANNASGTPSSHTWAAGLDYSNSNAFTVAYGNTGVPSLTSQPKLVVDTSGNLTVTGDLAVSGSMGVTSSDLPTGSILQVVSADDATQSYTTTSSDFDTTLSASITPSSTSSKIIIMIHAHISGNLNGGCYLKRGSTKIKTAGGSTQSTSHSSNFFNADDYGHNDYTNYTMSVALEDSPSTTSATTYTLGYRRGSASGGSFGYNRPVNNSTPKSRSTMTLMEVSG